MQSEPSLTIPPGVGTHHRGLQDFVESSRETCKGGKVTVSFVPSQRARRLIKVKGLEECFFKAPVRYNQCHFCRVLCLPGYCL